MEKNRIEAPSFCGGTCHRNRYQLLADRTLCPTPNPSLTRSLPSLTQRRSHHQFRPCRNQHQYVSGGKQSRGDILVGLTVRVVCLEPQHQPGGIAHVVFVGDTGKPGRHPVHLRQPCGDERQDFDI